MCIRNTIIVWWNHTVITIKVLLKKIFYAGKKQNATIWITPMYILVNLRTTIIVLQRLSVVTTKPVQETICATKNLSANNENFQILSIWIACVKNIASIISLQIIKSTTAVNKRSAITSIKVWRKLHTAKERKPVG